MLFAELLQDLRAGSRLVAEDRPADARLEGTDDLGREPGRIGPERSLGHQAGHLPVAGGRVLAGAALGHLPEGPVGPRIAGPGEARGEVAEAEGAQVGDLHVPGCENVSEGVAA